MNHLPVVMEPGELASTPMRRPPHRLRGVARRERARVRRQARGPVDIGLWLPLTPLFWLLSPFAFLLAPLLLLAPPMWRVNPYLAVFAIGRVLTSLGGTVVDVDAHDARIRLRIF